jgi:hypothetical protein
MIERQSDYEFPKWLASLFKRKPPMQPTIIHVTTAPKQCKNIVSALPRPATRRRHVPITRLQAERDLVTRLAFGETVASQDDLVARWRVDKSTVSKWLKRWEGEGLIPARTQSGRCKSLAKA